MHRQAQCTMNNSTRYKDHPTTTGVGGTNGRESKVAGLVFFFIIIIINFICGLGILFLWRKKKKITEADGSLDLSN